MGRLEGKVALVTGSARDGMVAGDAVERGRQYRIFRLARH